MPRDKKYKSKNISDGTFFSRVVRKPLKSRKFNKFPNLTVFSRRLVGQVKKEKFIKNKQNLTYQGDLKSVHDIHNKAQRRRSSQVVHTEYQMKPKILNQINLNKSEESPTKSICIDAQDFEEIIDSSCPGSSHQPVYTKSLKQHSTLIDSGSDKNLHCTAVEFHKEGEELFSTIGEKQQFSVLNQNKNSFYSHQPEQKTNQSLPIQASEMQYLYHLLTSPNSVEDKSVIVRHPNGDV